MQRRACTLAAAAEPFENGRPARLVGSCHVGRLRDIVALGGGSRPRLVFSADDALGLAVAVRRRGHAFACVACAWTLFTPLMRLFWCPPFLIPSWPAASSTAPERALAARCAHAAAEPQAAAGASPVGPKPRVGGGSVGRERPAMPWRSSEAAEVSKRRPPTGGGLGERGAGQGAAGGRQSLVHVVTAAAASGHWAVLPWLCLCAEEPCAALARCFFCALRLAPRCVLARCVLARCVLALSVQEDAGCRHLPSLAVPAPLLSLAMLFIHPGTERVCATVWFPSSCALTSKRRLLCRAWPRGPSRPAAR